MYILNVSFVFNLIIKFDITFLSSIFSENFIRMVFKHMISLLTK